MALRTFGRNGFQLLDRGGVTWDLGHGTGRFVAAVQSAAAISAGFDIADIVVAALLALVVGAGLRWG